VLGAKVTKRFVVAGVEASYAGTVVELWLDEDFSSVAHIIYDDGDEEDVALNALAYVGEKRVPKLSDAYAQTGEQIQEGVISRGDSGAESGADSRSSGEYPRSANPEDRWRRDGSDWIGRAVVVGGTPGVVEGWLPSSESSHTDQDGVAAPLWLIRLQDGSLGHMGLNELLFNYTEGRANDGEAA